MPEATTAIEVQALLRPKPTNNPRRWAHGDSSPETTEYRAWHSMISRCENPAVPKYKHYGARGIRVCDEWRKSYPAFLAHLGRKPSPDHSLDRIDNDGNYEPGNVKWSTREEQRNNQRDIRGRRANGTFAKSGETV